MDSKHYALWLLGRRSYSEKQLRDKLKLKNYNEADVESVIKYCLDRRYLDDLEYAKTFIRTRNQLRPRGARVLKLELRKRGIDKEIIERALNEQMPSDDDEKTLARHLVEQKGKQYAGIDRNVAKRRLFALLVRRGFNLQTIKEVLDDFFEKDKQTQAP